MSPLRDYKCLDCGFILEDVFFKRENDVEVPDKCPACNSRSGWERLLPAVCAHFNGPGFYENDYKKKKE